MLLEIVKIFIKMFLMKVLNKFTLVMIKVCQVNSPDLPTFSAPDNPNISSVLHHLLHDPTITKNLISVSKFAKDNAVYFESYANLFF